jgi:hypothetical protein
MITNANISEFIDNSIAERLERLGVTADRVIEQWAAIGFASMGDFLTADEHGCPTWDFEKATRANSAAIRDISIHTGGRGRRINIKLADKPAALMMLGKYLERAMVARRPEAPPTGTRYEIRHVQIIDPIEPHADLPQIANCHVEIRDPGSPGAEIFFATVCNARWADEHPDEKALADRSILVVRAIDEETIGKEVEERLLNRDFDSFDELVGRAAPLLRRESAEPEAASSTP